MAKPIYTSVAGVTFDNDDGLTARISSGDFAIPATSLMLAPQLMTGSALYVSDRVPEGTTFSARWVLPATPALHTLVAPENALSPPV